MKTFKKIISWESMPVTLLLIIIILVNYSLSPRSFRPAALNHFFLNNTAGIALAIGLTAALLSGGIDLSAGAIVALVDVVIVTLFDKGYPVSIVIPLAVLLGLGCGLINGIAIGVFRVVPLLATFASSFVFNGLAKVIMPAAVSKQFDKGFQSFYTGRIGGVIPITCIFILLLVIFWLIMMKRRMGIGIYATGQNELKAYLSGVDVVKVKLFAYTLDGFCAALGAIAMTASYGGGDAEVGANLSMVAMAAVVLGGVAMEGGQGNIFGAMMGALFLAFTTNLIVFLKVPATVQPLAKGLVYLLSLVFATLVKRIDFNKLFPDKVAVNSSSGGGQNE